jgi:hypothetical protein
VTFEATADEAENDEDCCAVRWSTCRDGKIGAGTQRPYIFGSPSERIVSAIATDSGGAIGKATILVEATNSAPTASITTPDAGPELLPSSPLRAAGPGK